MLTPSEVRAWLRGHRGQQKELAALATVSEPRLSRWLNSKGNLTQEESARLLRAMTLGQHLPEISAVPNLGAVLVDPDSRTRARLLATELLMQLALRERRSILEQLRKEQRAQERAKARD